MSLFFFETVADAKQKPIIRTPTNTPETGWRPPRDFPRLDDALCIARDRETKELDFDNGPGWARAKGWVVGESITAYDRNFRPTSWYFPIRHEVEPEYNLDPVSVTAFCRDVDRLPQTKIYANSIYDVGYGLDVCGELPNGELHDVQFAEAILSETDLTALDALGKKYLGQGKDTSRLYEWCAANYGGEPTGAQRANIYRASPRLVGPYAEEDSAILLPILMKQVEEMQAQGVYSVYMMECRLIRLLVKMRKRGVRIDLDKAEQTYQSMGPIIEGLERKLFDTTGVLANVDAGSDLVKVFDAVGVRYPITEKGNPSFTSEFLKSVEHPVGALVISIRQHKKLKSTFLKSYILDSHHNGRIHGQYHPLKSEEGGTRVGRLSSSTPNLQNIPSRTALGGQIREIFVPDIGSIALEKGDHSQLQYRLLAHFAVDYLGNNEYGDGPSSNALRAEYCANPHTDYHTRTQKMVQTVSGLYIPRGAEEAQQGQIVCEFEPGSPEYKELEKAVKAGFATVVYTPWGTGRFTIKETNFGLMFGMGKKRLIRQSGFVGKDAEAKGENIFNAYHQGNPYVKATMDYMSQQGQRTGYIGTLMDRRTRFDKWQRKGYHDPPDTPLSYDHALRMWGSEIERAGTYKALCNVLQGSEGEVIKCGMLACMDAGIYDVIGYPLLTTHDEVVNNVVDDSPQTREAFEHMRYLMANALPLRVPLVYESTRGPNWRQAKEPV